MADLTQTAANVRLRDTSTKRVNVIIAGETVVPGNSVYRSGTDKKAYRTRADTAANADAIGVCLSYGDADDLVLVALTGSTIDPGASATQGETYGVTDTFGGIGPISDRGTGDFITVLGTGDASNDIVLGVKASGIAKP